MRKENEPPESQQYLVKRKFLADLLIILDHSYACEFGLAIAAMRLRTRRSSGALLVGLSK